MEKGNLIGRGMTAEVFEWGNEKILKLYYNWAPKDWVKYEMNIGQTVYQVGITSPKVYDMIEVEGRYGIVYQRIFGKSMLKHIESNPFKLKTYSYQLARLHFNIHNQSTRGLNKQNKMIYDAIKASSEVLGDKTEIILSYLQNLKDMKKICHGDFHPDNILVDGDELIIIDWMNAYEGNPLCDVARTCLMLRSPFVMPGTPAHIAFLSKTLKSLFYKWYVKEYTRLSGVTYEAIDEWILPVATARLRENIPNEKEWLMAIIKDNIGKI